MADQGMKWLNLDEDNPWYTGVFEFTDSESGFSSEN